MIVTFAASGRAQQFTGTIQGVVLDATSAVLPGAEVSVINIGTNEVRHLTTDRDGAYVAPQLKPGFYRVVVELAGFKTATVDQIKVDVQQIRGVDVRLDVGGTSENISVVATAAPVETVSSTVSQNIENKRIVDLPLNGRNPFSLVNLSPGVVPAPGSSPFISGGRNATSEVTIDGISNVNVENNVSILDLNYTPSVDAVQEFSVQTNAVSAEFGRLGGGVINLITKSGTNQFHGTAFEFLRDSALDANNFFSDRAGIPLGSFRRNQFGGNIGGPVRRGSTFFFINYEGLRQRAANVGTFTVPLPEWRRGDFSNLRNAAGQPIIIYDPLTTRPDPANPGRFIRDPFPNNIVPPERISPIARNLMSYWPLPNTIPANVNTQANNFTAVGTNVSTNDQIDSRVDHEFSAKWRAFVRFSSQFHGLSRPFNAYGNLATPTNAGPTDNSARSLSVDNLYTARPTLLIDVRYGLNHRLVERSPFSSGFDITQLGFPSSVKQVAEMQALEFPRIDVNALSSLGQETFNDLVIDPTTHSFNVNATKILSRHTVKMGTDYRKFFLHFLQFGSPSGQYSFSQSWTQRDPNQGSSTAGFGLASLLIGVPDSGSVSHDPTPESSSSYWAFYVQDDWKVTQKLTLNLGYRYDFDMPRTERFDRLSLFDFEARSPLADVVPANPFFDPKNLKGAIGFVTPDHRRQTPTDFKHFGPRIGAAYSLNDKTVVRSAYGIFYLPSGMQAAGHTGSAGMVGYRTSSSMVVSLDGRTPIASLDNPFPNGFNLPTGNSLGADTFLGLGIGEGVFIDYRNPYMQQWNVNVQRELPGKILFEAAYIGSKGTRLLAGESGITLSQLPDSFLSLGTQLQDQVPNPFFGIITNPSSPLRFPTVARGRLLRPYPQYNGVNAFRIPYGRSIYHGLTLKADKRFSNGLSFLSAYTWNKLMDDVSTTVGFLGQASARQNAYDREAEWAIGSQDIRHRLVTSFVYELPFGKGQKFGANASGAVNRLIGGWQFNGIVEFQSGLPLIITQGANNVGLFNPSQRPTWNGNDANLSGTTDEKVTKWFDTSAFSITPAFTWGNTPRVMPDLRADGVKNFNLSIFKNNAVNGGKFNAQFRVEIFNAFNRVQFSPPATRVDQSNFGVVSGQTNTPRQVQLSAKLMF